MAFLAEQLYQAPPSGAATTRSTVVPAGNVYLTHDAVSGYNSIQRKASDSSRYLACALAEALGVGD
jgi:hypothetical protein